MIINPYLNTPHEDTFRSTIVISKEDSLFLRGLYPVHGAYQLIVGNLVKRLVEECKTLGLTHYSPENADKFEQLLRGRPVAKSPRRSSSSNGPRGKKKAVRAGASKQKVVGDAEDSVS